MKLVLIIFAVGVVFDALPYAGHFAWRLRNVWTLAGGFCTALVALLAVGHYRNVASVLFALAAAYRIFNAERVVKGRMHERYLRRTTLHTMMQLVAFQVVLAAGWWLWHTHGGNRRNLWLVISVAQFIMAAVLLVSTTRRLNRTLPAEPQKHYSDAMLPSITIAIPARNETEDLAQCLESIIANDYPKFEIVVLDDCSQDKHTPEIIRSFAHDGVRFIQGEQPRPTWLAKNQAYDQLAHEASGDYILFCGVDVRFERDSIRKLVTTMLERDKQMLSVLPRRANSVAKGAGQFSLVQAMRYWWELVPPRRMFNRPAVLSSCWIINTKSLLHAGGFAAVSRAIVPEAYFAKQLIAHDGYSFLRSDDVLGIESVKAPANQRDTAVRIRYPQLHRRPELVFLTSCLEVLFLFLPFVVAIGGWWLPVSHWTILLAALASICLVVSYEQVAISTRINHWVFALVALPLVVLADLAMLHRSMWKYEFSEVSWKGRNVCVPVMHVYPHLPKAGTQQ